MYLYLDNIFQGDKDVIREWKPMGKSIRNLDIEERNISTGFVKLSDEELKKRCEEDMCFKCNRKGH